MMGLNKAKIRKPESAFASRHCAPVAPSPIRPLGPIGLIPCEWPHAHSPKKNSLARWPSSATKSGKSPSTSVHSVHPVHAVHSTKLPTSVISIKKPPLKLPGPITASHLALSPLPGLSGLFRDNPISSLIINHLHNCPIWNQPQPAIKTHPISTPFPLAPSALSEGAFRAIPPCSDLRMATPDQPKLHQLPPSSFWLLNSDSWLPPPQSRITHHASFPPPPKITVSFN